MSLSKAEIASRSSLKEQSRRSNMHEKPRPERMCRSPAVRRLDRNISRPTSSMRWRSVWYQLLLGGGERLFEGVGDDLHGLELVRTVAAPCVTHLKFVRR